MKITKNNLSILALLLVLLFVLSNATFADPKNSCNLHGFVTYTQGGWGSPSNSTPGGIRDAFFSQVFPQGLVVGAGKTLKLTTSSAVNVLLPAGGEKGAFTENYVNVSSTSAGVFAGQLVALTLNIKFDEAGKIGSNEINLGDLEIKDGTFHGMTVNQFLVIANKAIGGQGLSGYTFGQFNDAATSINENFDNGTTDKHYLTCGESQSFSLGDFVWLDADKDGIQDASENGISGVTVKLYTSADVLIATTTTDAHGLYSFTNVSAASYYVQVTKPAGYTVSPKDQGSDDLKDSDIDPATGKTAVFTFASTADDLSRDAGMFLSNASVGDKVWFDEDKDGIQDDGENGISDVTVKLYTCADVLAGTTTTDGNGIYLFSNLNSADYYVQVTLPAGYSVSPKDAGSDDTKDSDIDPSTGKTACFTLAPGQNDNTRDAGLYESPASVGDKVWNDTDKDGIQDAGENGIPNVEVKLYDCVNNLVASTTTDANGNYLFSGLNHGEYNLDFTAPSGYTISAEDQGSDDAVDSDVEPSNGKTVCFTLEAGQNDLTWDAGMYITPASLGDFVWIDVNKDGIQDNSEPGLPGVTVELYTCGNVFQSSVITDADGLYKFENLSAGSYYVKFILPSTYTFTSSNTGNNDNVDSDADGSTGKTECVALAQGQNIVNVDAGMYLADVSADLRLEKTSSVTEPNDNESVTFTITVYNDGPSTATNVSVTDVLPSGLVYNSSAPSQGSYDNVSGLWTVGTLASGANAVLTVTATTSLAALNNTTVNLGPATGWNAFILEDLTQPSSDTEGKLAVGRDCNLANYSVGDKLPNSNGTVDVLVVGHDLTYTSGRVFNGNVVYGNSSNLPIFAVSTEEGTVRQGNIIDFAAAETYLSSLSVQLSNYTETDTTSFQWGSLDLNGDDPYLNVFNVNGTELGSAHTVNINVPNGSSVLVNISGTSVNWTGGLWITGTAMNNVLYNFYEATNIHMVSIDIRGTVLAPFAHVDFPTGLVSGQMIAKSLTGQVQFNNKMFNGNIPGTRTITNVAEVASSDQFDPDSNPNNGLNTEDDYAAATITIKFNTSGNPAGNWSYVGEFLPGEIVSFITNDVNGNLVAGTHWGKVYVSADNGANWTNINPNNTFGTVWSIAARNNNVYVATSQGAFKTVDNGAHWTATGLDITKDVRSIAIDATGNLYAGIWGAGVHKSVDGGTTWTSVNNGINNISIGAVTVSATGDIYVGTFGDGMFKSTDGGLTWSNIEVGFPYIWSVGVTADGTIFAGTYGAGVYVSNDGGANFHAMSAGLNNAFIYAITVDLAGNVYINSWSGGVYLLPAGQLTWTNMGLSGYGVSSIFINPANTEANPVVYVGTSDGKIYKNIDGVSSADDNSTIPTEFSLSQNYPNPFNPSTTIEFSITRNEMVNLSIFNILGEEVTTLINSDMTAGKHTVNFNAAGLNSGIYFYRITTPSQSVTKKMMLVK